MRELIGWRLAGKVAPVIEGTYPLADAAAVLKRVHGRGVGRQADPETLTGEIRWRYLRR